MMILMAEIRQNAIARGFLGSVESIAALWLFEKSQILL
jgi:hypothetical protein